MSIRNRLILVLTGAFVLAVILAACGGGPTTTDIVQTSSALNKVESATATAEVVIAAGGNPDEVEVEIGTGSAAELHNISAEATVTAEAEQGIVAEGVESGGEVLQGAAFDVEIPDGPAETGVIVVDIPQIGAEGMVFDPAIVKSRWVRLLSGPTTVGRQAVRPLTRARGIPGTRARSQKGRSTRRRPVSSTHSTFPVASRTCQTSQVTLQLVLFAWSNSQARLI